MKALLTELIEHERRVWDALVAGDRAADEALLADDFLGVYPSGFADRSDHADQLSEGPSIARYSISNCRARSLGDTHAMLSYHAQFQRHGRREQEQMVVTSIWQRHDNGWINVFSQDTPTS